MYSGPHIKRDGLVFGYDTGYSSGDLNLSRGRYFKGPLSTNLLQRLNTSYSNTQTTNFYAVAGEETVKIPKVGKRDVKYVEYFNNYPNSGTCCPNLFNYGEATVTPSTSYTYSIVYKHTGGYTHPNFMYRYEYNGGTYNTEGGFHSTASDRRRHLGNGWYHAWGSFTTQSTTNRLICYSFLYNYGTTKYKFYVAAISIVKNTSGGTHLIVPPHLILQPSTSISSTQSLIDLTKTTDIDVSNVSFDSDGQPTFDGTDDILNTGLFSGRNPSTSPFTVEAILKSDTTSGNRMWLDATSNGSNQRFYSALDDGGNNPLGIQGSPWQDPVPNTTNFIHQTIVMDGSTARSYRNGVATYTKSYTSYTLAGPLNIGGRSGYRWIGTIPIVKVYNQALSAQEVQQNYRAYKNRFDI